MKFGYLQLRVEGFNQMRLLTALTDAQVEIFDLIKTSPSVMSFRIEKKHSSKTFAILEKMCYNYTVEVRSDFFSLFHKLLKRIGIIVGAIVFSAALGFGYSLIWRVEVAGNEKVDSLTIERTLKENGIARFSRRRGLDCDGVRNVVNSVDGVLESSVEIHGGTLTVTVVEDTEYDPPESGNFRDVVSDYDAEITRIITSSGTALCQPGSRVFRGAPLIGAYREDAEGNRIVEEAKGSVYGIVAFSRTETFSVKEYVTFRTGKTYKSSRYRLFGLNIAGKENHGFESYETETQSVNAFENFFVPLKLERTVFYEVKEEEREYDPTERAEYFKSLLSDEIIVKAGGAEAETSYTLTRISENDYRITVNVQAEMLIGKS